MSPIPITVITGFLGSGKTTLILNLLPQLKAKNPDYKLALLKNEFGDLAVDSQLASSAAVSGVQELLNGCICCNLVGQLSVALDELQTQVQPDRIVIETSGSAFPATLALEVNRLAKETGGRYVLDGVVSVIDAENWQGYEDTSYTARVQARYTDLIVFNKWEGCSEDRFDEVLDRVGDLEVETPWVKSRKGWVGVDLVFGVDGGLARNLTEEQAGHGHAHTNGDAAVVNGHKDQDHDHDHDHEHQTEVEVLSIEVKGAPDGAVKFEKLLSLLKTALKEEVYRIKAVLNVSGPVVNSDDLDDSGNAKSKKRGADGEKKHERQSQGGRFILNWAFGRWTFTPVSDTGAEHASSDSLPARMTIILARSCGNKWKRKIESGGFLELDGEGSASGELSIKKIL